MPFDPNKFNAYVEEKAPKAEPVVEPATAPAFDPAAFNAHVESRKSLVDPIKSDAAERPGLLATAGGKALEGIAWVGDKLDRYVMGPSRAFVLAQTGPDSNFGIVPDRPEELRRRADGSVHKVKVAPDTGGGVGEGLNAAVSAIGEKDQTQGIDIAHRMGATDTQDFIFKIPGLGVDVATPTGIETKYPTASQAELFGGGLDLVVDPTNILPIGALAKGARRLTKGTAKVGTEVAKDATKFILSKSDLGQKIIRTMEVGGDVVDATKAQARSMAKSLGDFFKPSQSADFPRMSKIAQDNGIPTELLPESVEFGADSSISRLARVEREGALAEEARVAFNDGLNRVASAVDQKVAKIGGGEILDPVSAGRVIEDAFHRVDDIPRTISDRLDSTVRKIGQGEVLDPVQAGQAIKQGYDEAVDHFFVGLKQTYEKIAKNNEHIRLAPEETKRLQEQLGKMWKEAEYQGQTAVDAVQKAQARQTMSAVEAALQAGDDFGRVTTVLRNTGAAAYRRNWFDQIPPDVAQMRQLYDVMRDVVYETVRKEGSLGPKVADELKASNDALHAFFGDKSEIAAVLGVPGQKTSMAPERVFSMLTSDTRKIDAMRKLLSPEVMAKVKAAYLQRFLKRVDPTKPYNFSAVENSLANKGAINKALFDEVELGEVANVLRTGATHRSMGGYQQIFEGAAASPERTFSYFTRDTPRIEALKQILSPEELAQVKGAYLGTMKKEAKDGGLAFQTMINDAKRQEIPLKTLFTPEELSGYTDLLELGNNYGPMVMSSSGTGASHGIIELLKGNVKTALTNKALQEALKSKARGIGVKGTNAVHVRSPLPLPTSEYPLLPPGYAGPSILPSRTAADNLLKGAQVYETQKEKKK